MKRLLPLLVLLAGCRPSLDDTTSLVDAPRLLGVRAEPAEAKPGETVTLSAIYATPEGPVVDPHAELSFCMARKPLSEPGAVSTGCLGDEPGAQLVLGVGASIQGQLPRDACRFFGPDRPAGAPGEPAGRPSDPDGTGGFYQPGRARFPGTDNAIFEVRIRCGLSGVTQSELAEFERRYKTNVNPEFELAAVRGDRTDPIAEGTELIAAPRETLTLRATWTACDPEVPCKGAERYVAYDAEHRVIASRREAMRVSWFKTAGSLGADRTGRGEDDVATDTTNTFTAPESGSAALWLVLHDSRGGIGLRTFRVTAR